MILNLLYIAVILVFILDYSGFVSTIEEALSKVLSHGGHKIHFRVPKPFSCSLCMTFWTGLAYIFFTGNFSIQNILLVCLIAASTIILAELMAFVRDTALKIIDLIRRIFKI